MRIKVWQVVLVLILAALVGLFLFGGQSIFTRSFLVTPTVREVHSFIATDFDDDGEDELLVLMKKPNKKRAHELLVYDRKSNKLTEKKIFIPASLNPWKVRAADVNGDGKKEIILGVWKKTRFDPRYDNRLFVYKFDGKRLFPKWLGSRLSRPFVDFEFGDINADGKDELLAIEKNLDGSQRLVVYSWTGFGFIGEEQKIFNR